MSLSIIRGPLDDKWLPPAEAALAAGYGAEVIADAAYSYSRDLVHSVGDVEYWARWKAEFAKLEQHPNPEVREIARYGQEWANEEARRTERMAREAALHGFR